jgi:signal peptidase II
MMSNNPTSPPLLRKSALIWLWLSFVIIILDQASKILISATLNFNQPIAILPFFNLRLVHNTGAAWSLFANFDGSQRWFLSGLAILVSGLIIIWLYRLDRQQRWIAVALAFILGGAIGNVIDRLIYGYVIDFIDIYYQNWHWPIFNIADSGITLGAIMLGIDALKKPVSD